MNEEFAESIHDFRMYVMGEIKTIKNHIDNLYRLVENLERKEEAIENAKGPQP